MKIQLVEQKDKNFWMRIDRHTDDVGFQNRVYTKTGYVMWEDKCPIGILHYCVLWDNLPFLNYIFVSDEHRKKGYAREAMTQWEEEMKQRGYKMLLLSTQVDESAQCFYRKLGYVDCGGLLLNGTPFEQPMEMFMRKIL